MKCIINATLTDRAGNLNSTKTRIITLDSLNPGINFSNTTAINDSFLPQNYIFVNLTIVEPNQGNLTFYLYNSNLQLVNETNLTDYNAANATINFSQLYDTEEKYYYNATTVDQANNSNSTETRTIVLDLAPPRITLNLPVNDYNSTLNFINFSWIAIDRSDANISCNVTVNFVTKANNVSSPSGVIVNSTGLNLTDGYNFWNVSCLDELNNTNTSTIRNFTVLNGPNTLKINLSDDNETVILDWNDIDYAESYSVYIINNFSESFASVANVTGLVEHSNYTDINASNETQRFYKVAVVKGGVNKTSVKTAGKYEIELINNTNSLTDWNLISLPLNITNNLSNFRLFNGSNGTNLIFNPLYCIKSLWFFNATAGAAGQFRRTNYNGSAWVPATGSENFTSLEAGRGYWVEVNQTCNLTVYGEVPILNLSVPLQQNWNVIGWYSPNTSELPTMSAPDFLTPEPPYTPVHTNPVESVTAIDRYNPLTDKFEVTIHFSPNFGWFPSSNNQGFTNLDPTKGYYYDAVRASTWEHQPNTGKD